jgi:hypothetical protein
LRQGYKKKSFRTERRTEKDKGGRSIMITFDERKLVWLVRSKAVDIMLLLDIWRPFLKQETDKRIARKLLDLKKKMEEVEIVV